MGLLLASTVAKADPIGATISNPIDAGTYGVGVFNFSDTRDNSTSNGYLNNYGQSSDDIYYRLTLQGQAQVQISHCGSGLYDTYMYLLNSDGTMRAYDDDYGPLCGSYQASISITLPAGTYYIVSEGYNYNAGSITTNVHVVVSALTIDDKLNFARTWLARMPITDPDFIMSDTRTVEEVSQVTTYADGFGRPLQTVAKQVSPLLQDLVDVHEYDSWGREVKKHLPFISNVVQAGDITNDGNYKANAMQQQQAFNQALYPGENYYYSQASLENSPFNRSVSAYAPGNSWAGSARGTSIQYLVNTAIDNVQVWTISTTAGSLPVNAGAYPAGQLYKTIGVDEKGLQSIDYKDKDGHVILKKSFFSGAMDDGNGSAHAGWLCTYYIYDDYGYLRYLLPPKVIELIDGSWSISQTLSDELCIRYEYDLQGRNTVKKMPGANEARSVYDQRGRLVMSQDANQRALQKWQYFQYDNLDRPVVTGLIYDPAYYDNPGYHQLNASGSIAYPVVSAYAYEVLSQTFYDNYNWVNGTGTGLGNALDQSNTSNTSYYYTPNNTSFPYPQPIVQTSMVRGMATGSKNEVLGSNGQQYLFTVSFYDDKARIIQTQSTNISGAVDKTTTQYSWTGMALRVLEQYAKNGGSGQTYNLLTKMSYDPQGRMLTLVKKISGVVGTLTINGSDKLIASYSYNELGQLKSKGLGSNSAGSALETMQYDYNVRGWLLGMNRNYLKDAGSAGYTDNYFGFELGYDKNTSVAGAGGGFNFIQYNGNIAGSIWKSRSDQVRRKYDYEYDAANRLGKATFIQNTNSYGGGSWNTTEANYSVRGFDANNNWMLKYDANGNIQEKVQYGIKGTDPGANVDALRYYYLPNSNKLEKVIDELDDPNTKLGDFHDGPNGNGVDYSYDANGNLLSDQNKKISSITYNSLNLPSVITVTGKGTIAFTYDGMGNKIKKQTQETNASVFFNNVNYTTDISTITTYIGGLVFLSKTYSNPALVTMNIPESLQFAVHEEGRARIVTLPSGIQAFGFDYFIRDHLGNIRMTLTDEEQQDVYPAATLETSAAIGSEQVYYNIVNDANHIISTASLSWYASASGSNYPNGNGVPNPPDPTVNPGGTSTNLYKLNGATGDRFGMGIALKVMAGDRINILAKSIWHSNGAGIDNTNYSLNNVLSSFIDAFAGTSAGIKGGVTGGMLNGTPSFVSALGSLVNNVANPGTQTPKAYINWILFDDQFKPVQTGGGSDPVSVGADIVKTHTLTGLNIVKSGYLYIYCSNESNQDVYFDNLQVIHNRGPLIEERHYYPDGLAMAGISSRAFGKLQNNFGYQGKEMQSGEFADGSGLEEYDFESRFYDPQLGRWHTQDPAGQFASPYLAMGDNWVNGTDPDGALFGPDDLVVAAVGLVYGYVSSGLKTGNWGWRAIGNGFLTAAMFEIGYLTGGASAGLSGSAAMSTAGNFLATSAINIAVGQLFPSIPIQVGNFSFSVSPAFSLDGAGVSLNAGYSSGDFDIGFSYGFGSSSGTNDLSGGYKAASAGSYHTIGGSVGFVSNSTYYGLSLASSKLGGKAGQKTAILGVQAGDFSLRVDEDYIPGLGDRGDRFKTGGGTATYRINDDISLAFGLGMVTGEPDKSSKSSINGHQTYTGKCETPGAFRGGALYGGVIYRGYAYMSGINSEKVLHGVQNWIHRNWVHTPYFENMNLPAKPWSYFGNYSKTSLIY